MPKPTKSEEDASRAIEASLGYRFKDGALLDRALTHRSFAYELEGPADAHYERLEFLGDALLGLLVSEWLYHDDPSADEGDLSRRRQAVVRTSSLARAADRLGLGDRIRLGRGELATGGREKPSLLADAFEAVLGAIYLDGGVDAARRFFERELGEQMRAARESGWSSDDHKTRLQERLQGQLRRTPTYRIVSTTGPDHALRFTAEVLLDDELLGRGEGTNRKRAEQEAARRALAELDEAEQ